MPDPMSPLPTTPTRLNISIPPRRSPDGRGGRPASGLGDDLVDDRGPRRHSRPNRVRRPHTPAALLHRALPARMDRRPRAPGPHPVADPAPEHEPRPRTAPL